MNHKKLVQDYTEYEVVVGSRLHNLAFTQEDVDSGKTLSVSDEDRRGVLVYPLANLLGPSAYTYPEHLKGAYKDHTYTTWINFVEYLSKGSPEHVEMLWARPQFILCETPPFAFLSKHKAAFLTTRVAFKNLQAGYHGGLNDAVRSLEKGDSERANKSMAHGLRRLYLVQQLVDSHTFDVFMTGDKRAEVMAVKSGDYNFQDVSWKLESMYEGLVARLESGSHTLPPKFEAHDVLRGAVDMLNQRSYHLSYGK